MSNYLRACKSWKTWAVQHCAFASVSGSVCGVSYPAVQIHVTVYSTVYGVSYVHDKRGYQGSSENPLVKQLVEAAKCILTRPPTRNKPRTTDQVQTMVTHLERGTVVISSWKLYCPWGSLVFCAGMTFIPFQSTTCIFENLMRPFSWRSRTTTSSMKGHGCLSAIGASSLHGPHCQTDDLS